MSNLAYCIRRLSSELGLSNIVGNPDQRARVVDIINEAAKEIYTNYDLPGCDRELTVQVYADTTIALPPYVGTPKAIRAWNYNYPTTSPYMPAPISITSLTPRYNSYVWANKWNKWRFRGWSPLAQSLTDASPLTFKMDTYDSTVTITVVGETLKAHTASEKLTMSSEQTTVNSFISIKSITKNKVNSENVIVYNAAGDIVSVVLNDMLEAKYQIYDVSEYPNFTFDGPYRKMEVLYKDLLQRLERDEDTFPVPDFYDIIIQKAFQILAEWKPDKIEQANFLQARVDQKITKKTGDIENRQQRVMDFPIHPFTEVRNYNLDPWGSINPTTFKR